MKLNNPLLHAEIVVLDKLKDLISLKSDAEKKEYIDKLELFVNMEPCIFCIGALRIMEIPKIYYGLKNERFGGCGSICNGHNDKKLYDFVPDIEVFEDERTLDLLKKFYSQTNMAAPEHKRKIKKTSQDITLRPINK